MKTDEVVCPCCGQPITDTFGLLGLSPSDKLQRLLQEASRRGTLKFQLAIRNRRPVVEFLGRRDLQEVVLDAALDGLRDAAMAQRKSHPDARKGVWKIEYTWPDGTEGVPWADLRFSNHGFVITGIPMME